MIEMMNTKKETQQATQDYYNQYPFIEGGEKRIAWWRRYLTPFLPNVDACSILDVGSGIGEITKGLSQRGAQMTCLDMSEVSLQRCREINPQATVVHGSALSLPFADQHFDHVISIGVLHHTPDCRAGFREVARVVRPGGHVVIFLYQFWSPYHLIYKLFSPFRRILSLEHIPRFIVKLLGPLARWHLGVSLPENQLRRLLGDKLWTPQATFHSRRQIVDWGVEDGLLCDRWQHFFLGYATVYRFTRLDRPAHAQP